MIVFDFCLGPFDLLVERETRSVPFKVTREGPGETFVNVGRHRLTFTNHRRCPKAS
ncbi:hypothetical protein RUM8411_01184 [Ruegeria meonggei]|uniref:Uncharacterized protein n=1 Tax=Ruegeria meonggei TaxID=1446476 RepID=A0A1X6YS01_9RHOB|nr:hypothetical protein RUM8411_01184 [Ruegeria meonggei]